MASESRIRQTVLALMGLFSSSCARRARSVVDCRLSGLPVLATRSQAMETMMALSRGGKHRFAAPSRSVFEGKLAVGPALPPAADAIGMEVEAGGHFDVGKQRLVLQQQDQLRSLSQMRSRRARRHQPSCFADELVGKSRAIVGYGSRHVTPL
jgi:hypothetical protein